MSFNLRLRVRKSKYNGLRSYGLEIVRNWRDDRKGGEPNHKTVAYIKTLQEQHFDVPSNQNKLRQKIETETLRLLKDGTIKEADAQKIIDKAAILLPKSKPHSH
jgi:hypothetical protein